MVALIPLFGIPLAIFSIIPFIGIFFYLLNYGISIWYYVMIGIAAWGNPPAEANTVSAKPKAVKTKN